MLKSLKIENFRCFQTFELQQLGQINLLVGKNNSGKTSILEAIQLLKSRSNLEPLLQIMLNRGEYILNERHNNRQELDIRHLFYGHEIDTGSKFSISNDICDHEKISMSIKKLRLEQLTLPGLFNDSQEQIPEILEQLGLLIEWTGYEDLERVQIPNMPQTQKIPQMHLFLSDREGLPIDKIRPMRRNFKDLNPITQFVTSSALSAKGMIEFFDQIVLTPEEDIIIEALQTIEPTITRIAPIISGKNYLTKSGFVVKLQDGNQRIPIGSMGDGMWRILGLTLAIVNAKNGVLLVDEIDTGLHYSTMSDMWRLIWKTAQRLNVQVFATTHNSDCWQSLAAIANPEKSGESGITIHRIEKDKPHSVVFTEKQIIIATENNIEVR